MTMPQAIRKDPAQILLERAIRRAVERQQQLRAERRRWWLNRIGEGVTVLLGVALFAAFWWGTPA
jgi:hypothetical protein